MPKNNHPKNNSGSTKQSAIPFVIQDATKMDTPLPNVSVATPSPGKETTTKRSSQNNKRYRKPNFYKYELVKEDLIKQLDGKRTAAEISKNLNLSSTTFYKYKALADTQAAPGQVLMTLEEKIFNDKMKRDNDDNSTLI